MKLLTILSRNRIKLAILVFIIGVSVLSFQQIDSINSFDGNETITEKFQLFTFSSVDTNDQKIQTAFLVSNPYQDFLRLQKHSKVLFASSASFVLTIDLDENPPVGLCTENGTILNKMPNQNMDALVVIDSKNRELRNLKVLDLDNDWSDCTKENCIDHFSHGNIRDDVADSYEFLQAIDKYDISSFQTQLVYTNALNDADNFGVLTNGTNDRSRRFLAICRSADEVQHVIIDCLEEDYLMSSAKKALKYLREQSFNVEQMVNLDIGSKDIIHVHNGEYLENLRPDTNTTYGIIENASSLLVYYIDK